MLRPGPAPHRFSLVVSPLFPPRPCFSSTCPPPPFQLGHTDLSNGAHEDSLAGNLIKGIRKLTLEIDVLNYESRRPGGAVADEIEITNALPQKKDVVPVSTGLFFRLATAIEHRSTMARCLYFLYSTTQISLFPKGNKNESPRSPLKRVVVDGRGEPKNQTYEDFAQSWYASGPQPNFEAVHRLHEGADPPPWTVHEGNELYQLVELIREMSDNLYESDQHTDAANPLWEVASTLCLALFKALDFTTPRIDADLGRMGFFNRFLVGAFVQTPWMRQDSSPLISLYDDFIALGIIRRVDPNFPPHKEELFPFYCINKKGFSNVHVQQLLVADLPAPSASNAKFNGIRRVYWSHSGFQGLVTLAFAHWLHALYDSHEPAETHDGKFSFMTCAPEEPNDDLYPCSTVYMQTGEVNVGVVYHRTLRLLIRDALSSPSKAVTMLSKIASSRSFGSSSITRNGDAVRFIHSVVHKFIRLDLSAYRLDDGTLVHFDLDEGSLIMRSGLYMQARLLEEAREDVISSDFATMAMPRLMAVLAEPDSKPRPTRVECALVVGSSRVNTVFDGGVNHPISNHKPQLHTAPAAPLDCDCRLGGCFFHSRWIVNFRQVHETDLLPDCLEDVLTLLTILVRGDSRLAVPYWHLPDDDVDVDGDGRVLESETEPLNFLPKIVDVLQDDIETLARAVEDEATDVAVTNALRIKGHMTRLDEVVDRLVAAPDSAPAPLAAKFERTRRLFAAHFNFLAAVGSPIAPFVTLKRKESACSEQLFSFLQPSNENFDDVVMGGDSALSSSAAHAGRGFFSQFPPLFDPNAAAAANRNGNVFPWSFLLNPNAQCLVRLLAMAASEADPDERTWREDKYHRDEAAYREQRNFRAHGTGRSAAPPRTIEELRRLVSKDPDEDPEEPRPVQPENRRPQSNVIIALLRVITVACSDPHGCNFLCRTAVRLPARAKPPYADQVTDTRAAPGFTNLITILFKLVKVDVDLRVKAAVIRALTSIAAGSANWAAVVLSGVESSQLIHTMPLTTNASDLRQEHDRIETLERSYDYTLSFIDLMRTLNARVATHTLGSRRRSPGIEPHINFILQAVFLRASSLPTDAERPADKWKLMAGPLNFAADILRRYRVCYPAAPEDEKAVVAARHVEAALAGPVASFDQFPDSAILQDAAQQQIDFCVKRGDGLEKTTYTNAAGESCDSFAWFLCAVDVDLPARFAPSPNKTVVDSICDLFSLSDLGFEFARAATFPEVAFFLGRRSEELRRIRGSPRLGGGTFCAYAGDTMVYYNQEAPPSVEGGGLTPINAPFGPPRDEGRIVTVWLLCKGGMSAVVNWRLQVPAEQSPVAAIRARGFVAGDPRFDFCRPLPNLFLPGAARGVGAGARNTFSVGAPHSAGFLVMRMLLTGGDFFRAVIDVLRQTHSAAIDAAIDARIAAAAAMAADKAIHESHKATVAMAIRNYFPGTPVEQPAPALCNAADAAHGELELGSMLPRGADGLEDFWSFQQRPGCSASIALKAVFYATHSSNSGSTGKFYNRRRFKGLAITIDRQHYNSAQKAEETFAFGIGEGVSGTPPAADAASLWRERALVAALSLLDIALSHDEAFLQGNDAVKGAPTGDPMRALPQLLFDHGALAYIARAATYRHDPRIALLAARVLYRISAIPRDNFFSSKLVADEALDATRARALARRTGFNTRGLQSLGPGTRADIIRSFARFILLAPTGGGYESDAAAAAAFMDRKLREGLEGEAPFSLPRNEIEEEIARLTMRERSIARRRKLRERADVAFQSPLALAGPIPINAAANTLLLPQSYHAWAGEEDDIGALVISNIAIPVSCADGATGFHASNGWAMRILGSGSRVDPLAPGALRNMILQLILGSIAAEKELGGAGAFSLGHALLGITFSKTSVLSNMHAHIEEKTRDFVGYCLSALAQILAGHDEIQLSLNRPRTFELAARVLESLFRDPRIALAATSFLGAWVFRERNSHPVGALHRFVALALLSVPLTFSLPALLPRKFQTILDKQKDFKARPGAAALGMSRVVAGGAATAGAIAHDEHDVHEAFASTEGELPFTVALEFAHAHGLAHLQTAIAAEIHARATEANGSTQNKHSLRTLGQVLLSTGGAAATPYIHRALSSLSLASSSWPGDEPQQLHNTLEILSSLADFASGAVTLNKLESKLSGLADPNAVQNAASGSAAAALSTRAVSASVGVLVYVRPSVREPLQTYHLGLLRSLCFEYEHRLARNSIPLRQPPVSPWLLPPNSEAVLRWASDRNRHAISLQAAYARTAAVARVLGVLIEHVRRGTPPSALSFSLRSSC